MPVDHHNNIINYYSHMHFLSLLANNPSPIDFNLSGALPNPASHPSLDNEPSAFRRLTGTKTPPPLPEGEIESSLSIETIMEQRQRLINQFLQLNIQMLEKEIHHQEPSSLPPKDNTPSSQPKPLPKKIRKMNHCGHEQRPHYAKGMCSNCYHRHGRVKRPWNCQHEKLYAGGLCQNCYINQYNRKRREDGKAEEGKNEGKGEKMDQMDPQMENTQVGAQCDPAQCEEGQC